MIEAWHFVGERLYDGRPTPLNGEWLEHEGTLKMCEVGYHASERAIDALGLSPPDMRWACQVECNGEIIEGYDKLVASRRRILWRIEAEPVLRAWGRWCAFQVIHLWDAPEVTKDYLEAGDEAIRDVSWSAAKNAWSDTLSATRLAARGAAAMAAAGVIAWAASGAAAQNARDAASAAASGIATYTTWAITRIAQSRQLEHMLHEAHEGRTEWIWRDST